MKTLCVLDILSTVKSAAALTCHYAINESTVWYIKKKEMKIGEAVAVVKAVDTMAVCQV